MAFAPVFPRVLRPPFGPGLAESAAGGVDWSQWFDHFWQAKGAASQAASYIDLVGSSDLTVGSAPTWSSGAGWSFNGSTQYLTYGPATAPTATWSIMLRFANVSSTPSATLGLCGALGGNDTTGILWLNPAAPSDKHVYHNMSSRFSSEFSTTPNLTAGVMTVAGASSYLNGNFEGSCTQSSQSNTTAVAIGCVYTVNYGTGWHIACDVVAVGIKESTMSSGDVAAAYAAMAAL